MALLPFLACCATAWALQALPPVQFGEQRANAEPIIFQSLAKTIYIDNDFADTKDSGGLTLIPPSAFEFAQTFQKDLQELTGDTWDLRRVDSLPSAESGIFLGEFRGDPDELTYENGEETEEGYEVSVRQQNIYIGGSGARGMWWGTRTLLQQYLLSDGSTIGPGRITDAPAYATRGFMLDAGRKWYAPAFLKDLCTYASFFKMNEFHYHSSDNYPLNRGNNDTWEDVYSQFSLQPESSELRGIIQRENETLSREDFKDFQHHCAQRGVTVIPEIEAPGHALSITKWKPDLALPKRDLLDLSNPDSLETVKSLWEEFLPWFQTKEVHIGADEYDPELADDYINFVNDLADFIDSKSGKSVRIWGTHEPSEDLTINENIIIQHWQYGQSDPVQLQDDGYQLINSQDWWAYMSLKNDHTPIFPAPYPQFFNVTRILNFGDREGEQWQPALFNPVNSTEQLENGASGNKGAILAAWNDNGPDATTQLEAYYALRKGIPIVAARAWTGSRGDELITTNVLSNIDFLASAAPGQDLDRRLDGPAAATGVGPLVTWPPPDGDDDSDDDDGYTLDYGSKGMNYSLVIYAHDAFTLLSPDVTLELAESGALTFTADGTSYPLRSTAERDGLDGAHPGRIWANVTSSSHEPVSVALPVGLHITGDPVGGTRVYMNGTFAGRFEVLVYGGRNAVESWSQMAFVAPVQEVKGGVHRIEVWEGCFVRGG
ncbi:glycoside hydrolase family 20 protein [Patellaria atrata CBS 101060]|uniref:beta-N-acetylhexosaminidase n=1 Tax=Patellaria atrata CBS 101060 TaxID=1346257 RepID=A0A9P4SFM7_9PEZI|nr:glycoside hydrolase family 20 protein [Patellaria atrata CBS 101060]